MKKFIIFIIVTIVTVFLTSCSNSIRSGIKITAPKGSDSPIYGEWNITKLIKSKNDSDNYDNYSDFTNKKLHITKDYYVLGDFVWDKISLETKSVDSTKYFDSLGIDTPSFIVGKSIEVFSVIKDKSSMAEITLSSNNTTGIIKTVRGVYQISKVSSSKEVDLTNKKAVSNNTLSNENTNTYNEGILLALKTPTTDNKGTLSFSYRTIWISAKNGKLNPMYQSDSIIFTKKSGFWELTEHNVEHNNFKENIFKPIEISNSNDNDNESLNFETTPSTNASGTLTKEITYICNDFISMNVFGNLIEDESPKTVNKLQIYPISNLPFEKAVSFKDIFKDTSLEMVRNELKSEKDNISGKNISYINDDEEKNIGILRRDSHWFFTGRINYLDNNIFSSLNYDINVLPPSNIVYYDSLFMPVDEIESDIDGIKDVFSSPKKKLALIMTNDNLYIFNIIENDSTFKLEENSIGSIKLNENESVIMSEWSTDGYVYSWDKFIKSSSKFIKIDE